MRKAVDDFGQPLKLNKLDFGAELHSEPRKGARHEYE